MNFLHQRYFVLETCLLCSCYLIGDSLALQIAELMEYAKELGRNRNDLYEIPVWRESINVVGNELYYMQAVHQESDVVPENIDAIRALLEMESDNEKSIAKTNKAMGIL